MLHSRRILCAAVLSLLMPLSALAQNRCSDAPKRDTLVAKTDMRISVTSLRDKYHWNGKEVIWQWDSGANGLRMDNGSDLVFSPGSFLTADEGVPFTMGFGGAGYGRICVGNLQIEGQIKFVENAVLLRKGAKVTFPVQ